MGQEVRRKIGKYITERILGRGAMGVVFLATDPTIGRKVAIKCIHIPTGVEEDKVQEFRERFLREARAAGVMSHPNIVTIYEADEGGEKYPPFIAMEYIEGETWNHKIKRGEKLSPDHLFPLLREVASALEYAHKNGVIHRDIKPGNIIQTFDNRVKLMDFGIAKVPTSELTREGQFLGTPAYMSPEQVKGKAVDQTCDIFSLGAVAYEMISGKKPFEGEEITVVLNKIVNEEPKNLRELNKDVSKEAWAIIKKMLRKDVSERYQSASELIADIDAYLAGAVPPYAQDYVEKTIPPIDSEKKNEVRLKKKSVLGYVIFIGFILLLGVSILIYFLLKEKNRYDYSVILPDEIVNTKTPIQNNEEKKATSQEETPIQTVTKENEFKPEVKKEEEKKDIKPKPPINVPPQPKKEVSTKPPDVIETPKNKKPAVQSSTLNFIFDFGGTRKGEATLEIDRGQIKKNKAIDRKMFEKKDEIWSETISLPPGKHSIKVVYRAEIMGYYGTLEEEKNFIEGKTLTLNVKIHKTKKVPIFIWSE